MHMYSDINNRTCTCMAAKCTHTQVLEQVRGDGVETGTTRAALHHMDVYVDVYVYVCVRVCVYVYVYACVCVCVCFVCVLCIDTCGAFAYAGRGERSVAGAQWSYS